LVAKRLDIGKREIIIRIKVILRRFCAGGVDLYTVELVSEKRKNYVTHLEVHNILPLGVYIVVNLTTDSHVPQQDTGPTATSQTNQIL
jgi:hypothetical protein